MFHTDALPRIIGRSDMEVNDNSDRHELNEFFNEQIMVTHLLTTMNVVKFMLYHNSLNDMQTN